MTLTKEDVEKIIDGYSSIQYELNQLIIKILPLCNSLEKENKNAFDYCQYGLLRRIYLIKRCLENFLQIAPPANPYYLSHERRGDLNLFLHSFLLNISGAIDDLAWVWFYKRNIDQKEDVKKFRTKINLFGKGFRKYLDRRIIVKCDELKKWHDHLKNFRDPTAHRVPPYIIPYTIDPKDNQKHYDLEKQLSLTTENNKQIIIQKELDKLRDYEPKYMHSYIEESNIVRFHPQNIADTRTLCVLTELVIECLANNSV